LPGTWNFFVGHPIPDFEWNPYLEKFLSGLLEFGLRSEAIDKSQMDQHVKRAILKDNSISNQLNLSFDRDHLNRKLKIKLEIDVNPPSGSGFAYSYLDFPLGFEVCHQDLASNFSLKIHALLCRPCLKGRDWYDFNWYVKQNVHPNYVHLQSALTQLGPWQDQSRTIDRDWLTDALAEKVSRIGWKEASAGVARFLSVAEQQSLTLWNKGFFRQKIEKI